MIWCWVKREIVLRFVFLLVDYWWIDCMAGNWITLNNSRCKNVLNRSFLIELTIHFFQDIESSLKIHLIVRIRNLIKLYFCFQTLNPINIFTLYRAKPNFKTRRDNCLRLCPSRSETVKNNIHTYDQSSPPSIKIPARSICNSKNTWQKHPLRNLWSCKLGDLWKKRNEVEPSRGFHVFRHGQRYVSLVF